ncbi:MAG: NAD(P)-dependent oxidoreductase [Bacteroidota bacterium]
MKIGIIREEKVPHDKRVPFTPSQCKQMLATFPGVQLVIQPSPYRCYTDKEYTDENITLQEDLNDCDILMGVKEVPVDKLIDGKKYFFFSHTIKKQPHNRKLLKEVLKKKISLVDYETLTDPSGNRVIGFGRYAGIVGAYNGVMAYGMKYGLFQLKAAHLSHDKKELFAALDHISLPNIKIVVTGGGRVANGACETMGALNIRKVTPYEFLNYSFREPVYIQLHSHDYYQPKDGSPWSDYNFHHFPQDFECTFSKADSYASKCDMLIHCTFWDPRADILFTKAEMRNPDFRISVIADVTCDIDGSIPSTMKATSIEDKFYGYNPETESIEDAFAPSSITVMSIDNLPCELPRDASDGFGRHLLERVIPSLIVNDESGLIARATIAEDGKLTERFNYLSDYISG